MSVVVRMEMPKSCWDCPCFDDYGDYPRCEITNEQRGYNFPIHEKRMPNCPIICQLPEGHGRLIDVDAAVNDIKYEILGYKIEGMKGTPMPTEHLWLTKNWIADEDICPTIAPAERSET